MGRVARVDPSTGVRVEIDESHPAASRLRTERPRRATKKKAEAEAEPEPNPSDDE